MNLSNKVLIFCLAFIFGIALASWWQELNNLFNLFFLITALAVVFLFKRKTWSKKHIILFIVIILIGFLFGLFRFQLSKPAEISIKYLKEGGYVFQGRLVDLPASKTDKQSLVLDDIVVETKADGFLQYQDKILITSGLYPEYKLGDILEIECSLKNPGKIENFDYGEYLANSQIYKVCYYPRIKIVGTGLDLSTKNNYTVGTGLDLSLQQQINFFFLKIKSGATNLIKNNLPVPHSALLSAIILGERSEISSNTRLTFSQVGLSHIIAISGMHISVLSLIIFNIFLILGIGRQKSFKFILVLLILYLFLIGFRASAIRAVLMGLILAYAEKEGRLSSSGRAVILAAGFLLLLNPRLLRWDVGFQLSFLATIGIVYLVPYFNLIFKKFKYKQVTNILSMTMAAQLSTWPLVAYNFGILSFIGIVANLIVVPVLSVVLIFGIVFILVAIFIPPPFLFIFSLPVWLVLSYILKIGELFSQIKFSYSEVGQFNFLWVIFFYALILTAYIYLRKKIKNIM